MTLRILKYFLFFFGCLFLILFIFCLTSAPFWTWYNLSTKHAGIHCAPEFIVVLGGGGMPSESGLMRTWYAARLGNHFTRSKIIIALPGDTADSLSSVYQMKEELILRGISGNRISFESLGTNTRAQAMNLFKRITNIEQGILNDEHRGITKSQSHKVTESQIDVVNRNSSFVDQYSKFKSILIVTSPEHLYRAVRTFRKAGFLLVDGAPAFETAIESELSFDDRLLGGKRWLPPIGKNITARYQFWTQLHYEELILREWIAIVYYKLNGWI
jgi:uncharacterized SAM-binding protein YcdF (DUF218 family)